MLRRKRTDGLAAGRHADPVDQADAILWAEDVRLRALALICQQDAWLDLSRELGLAISADQAAEWMIRAYFVLQAVSRG